MFGYNINQRSGLPYAGIIRPVRINDVVYLPAFYNKLKSNRKQPAEEIEDTEAINTILKKAWDNKGAFSFRQGAHSLTIQDLDNVLLLLEDLGLVRGKGSKAVAEFIEEECEVVIDEDRFRNDRIDALIVLLKQEVMKNLLSGIKRIIFIILMLISMSLFVFGLLPNI